MIGSSRCAIGTRSTGIAISIARRLLRCFGGSQLDTAHRHQTVDASVDAVGRERRELVSHHVLLDEQLDGDPGRHDHRVLRHHVADKHALECVTRLLAGRLATRGGGQEPSDEHQPDARRRDDEEQVEHTEAVRPRRRSGPRAPRRRSPPSGSSCGSDESARILPPSSGNAGMRLKTSTGQVDRRKPLGDHDHEWGCTGVHEQPRAIPQNAPAITNVITGPIAATSISVLPVMRSLRALLSWRLPTMQLRLQSPWEVLPAR